MASGSNIIDITMHIKFFKTVYNLPSLKEGDCEAIAGAHEKLDFTKGSLLLEEGNCPRILCY